MSGNTNVTLEFWVLHWLSRQHDSAWRVVHVISFQVTWKRYLDQEERKGHEVSSTRSAQSSQCLAPRQYPCLPSVAPSLPAILPGAPSGLFNPSFGSNDVSDYTKICLSNLELNQVVRYTTWKVQSWPSDCHTQTQQLSGSAYMAVTFKTSAIHFSFWNPT